jgi:TorA maturation chaperone TorD
MTVTTFDPAVCMARQALYRFAAVSLLDPRANSWVQLAAIRDEGLILEAASLIRGLPEAALPQLELGERPLVELDASFVLAKLPQSACELRDRYEGTFGLLVSNACPPYETEYIDSKFAYQRSNTLADVSGFYHAFGVSTSDTRPERPDHVVLELEFMAFLLGLQRRADSGDTKDRQGRMEICRDAQARFLCEHLAWWIPTFAKLLAHQDPGGFYECVGVFLAALIPAERALLGVEAGRRAAAPSSLERPESCEGCELASP